MGKYKKILVAFDGSESSRNALLSAFKLANDEKCWITVASVVPPYEGEMELIGLKDIRASLRKPCLDALSEAQKIADAEKALIKTVCEEGEIHSRIVDLADAENCDIIVMGKKGLSRIERTLVGSTTARVIGHSHRDIMVIPMRTSIGWEKIVIATDGSIYSHIAADKAIDFAKSYGGELIAISVVDILPEYYAEAQNAIDNLIGKTKEFVADIKKKAEAAKVPVSTYVAEGEAYKIITDFARDKQANIIVMGSHGRTGLKRLLMGSVTEKVIGYAPCPVLVVKM